MLSTVLSENDQWSILYLVYSYVGQATNYLEVYASLSQIKISGTIWSFEPRGPSWFIINFSVFNLCINILRSAKNI